jgi:carboxylate-amine ligase
MAIGSAGAHPFAMWEDQRIVARPRYRDLISALRFVARQEVIFGMHVHVGIDDPEKAIHVANGMCVHLPVLLGLSANSPFWRADATGMASTRTSIFRVPAGRGPAAPRRLGRLRAPDRVHDPGRRDRGLHLPLA